MTPATRKSILMVAGGLDPVGTGRQLELTAAGFRDAGWEVRVAFTTADGSLPSRLTEAGFAVHRLSGRPRIDAAAAARLVRLTRAVRPAVVHAWGRSQARLVAAARPLSPRARVVAHLAVAPRNLPTTWALRRADLVIAASPAVARACERGGVPSGSITVIPPGIDAAAGTGLVRERLAARLGLSCGKTWTLCVAPLEPESRLERLLWAIDQLGVVHDGLEHVLVGSGPLLQRVLRRARVQQLAERLRLVASCDCLPDLLRHVRLVWQSGEVALGGVLLDAMSLGIPAVAVASAAANQLIVDQETGRLVAADPESDFPRRALQIIEDDALAARYGAAARARAEQHFPPAPAIAKYIDAVRATLR
jgi:glycosyltransferase involved in cell wall biosynthesis